MQLRIRKETHLYGTNINATVDEVVPNLDLWVLSENLSWDGDV